MTEITFTSTPQIVRNAEGQRGKTLRQSQYGSIASVPGPRYNISLFLELDDLRNVTQANREAHYYFGHSFETPVIRARVIKEQTLLSRDESDLAEKLAYVTQNNPPLNQREVTACLKSLIHDQSVNSCMFFPRRPSQNTIDTLLQLVINFHEQVNESPPLPFGPRNEGLYIPKTNIDKIIYYLFFVDGGDYIRALEVRDTPISLDLIDEILLDQDYYENFTTDINLYKTAIALLQTDRVISKNPRLTRITEFLLQDQMNAFVRQGTINELDGVIEVENIVYDILKTLVDAALLFNDKARDPSVNNTNTTEIQIPDIMLRAHQLLSADVVDHGLIHSFPI